MPNRKLDRSRLQLYPLSSRENKIDIERDHVPPDAPVGESSEAFREAVGEAAARVRAARAEGRPVVLAFGAHAIKNGLAPVLIHLLEGGWATGLATNGAGIIHDWEFAFQGQSSEDVRENVAQGKFGLWQETGHHLNLALALGAYDGLGYGEAVGRLIASEQHVVPATDELRAAVQAGATAGGDLERAAAAADLLAVLERGKIASGVIPAPHPWQRFSVQAAAYRLGLPLTGHPMFGHDIIYTHPLNHGGALGRCAERDFLAFAEQISRLDGGVYISVGSAVMSPMIFEKSMAMAQNLAQAVGRALADHFILVADLAESTWDWSQGEPPPTSPDYYLRFRKTFDRMGGTRRYLTADNRDFLLALAQELGAS